MIPAFFDPHGVAVIGASADPTKLGHAVLKNILREMLLRISQLVTDFPEIVELDINPLVLLRGGQGAVAIDMRLVLEG